MLILNLVSGEDLSIAEAIRVDNIPETAPDIGHDLNKVPWPFDDNTIVGAGFIDFRISNATVKAKKKASLTA